MKTIEVWLFGNSRDFVFNQIATELSVAVSVACRAGDRCA